jgi:hypothetical protein
MATERIRRLLKQAQDNAEAFEGIRRARADRGQESDSAPIQAGAKAHLLAQGDSWFDYVIGCDILCCLRNRYGRNIDSIAVAGSALNDIVYGSVPDDLLDFDQTPAPSRLAELVYRIQTDKPPALLLSAGGDDVAGGPFYSFVDNANSDLNALNSEVLKGVVDDTLRSGYKELFDTALAAAHASGNDSMIILTHGYDYLWPDGRGVLWIKGLIGPWFDPAFNAKNYPLQKLPDDMDKRRAITKKLVDAINEMLLELEKQYAGRVVHVDLRNTLTNGIEDYRKQWANELHPTNPGFELLADAFDRVLRQHL